jgi:hypothetical protein
MGHFPRREDGSVFNRPQFLSVVQVYVSFYFTGFFAVYLSATVFFFISFVFTRRTGHRDPIQQWNKFCVNARDLSVTHTNSSSMWVSETGYPLHILLSLPLNNWRCRTFSTQNLFIIYHYHFHLSGNINRYHQIWWSEDRYTLIEHTRDSPKLDMFCFVRCRKTKQKQYA